MRVAIHVRPGSRTADVGGRHGVALVVRVRERSVDGRATEAALSALASALGVPRRDVTLVRGARSRAKLVEVPDAVAAVVTALGDRMDRP
jgi:uncharacterized protein YggU (UPF0235/DUF167 family)